MTNTSQIGRRRFIQGVAAVLALACCFDGRTPAAFAAAGDDGLVFDLDFNAIADGKVADRSPTGCKVQLVGVEACQGVDGYAVRLPGTHACVTVELPEADRKLDALSLDFWVSPEEAAHQEVVTAASARSGFDDLPIMLRWRLGWQMGFAVQAADNERRSMIPPQPCLDTISFPQKRSWMHVVATYDGETTALYINGKPYTSTKWSGKKPVMPIAFPVKIGGHGGLFRGAVDEFRMYRRALSPDEVKASYARRAAFKPHVPPREVAGTLDGKPYFGCGRGGSWAVLPLGRGALRLSNTGEMELWGVSKVNPSNQFDYLHPIGVLGQSGWRERYYREVSGNIEFHRDGTARLDIAGRTAQGLQVRQSVEVNARDEIHARYDFAADDARVPMPGLSFNQHLWPAALRFVGHDERGPITGNLMDLDGDLWFRDLLEVNLVSSDNRLVMRLGPQTRLHVRGTRDPARWLNGYTTIPGEILPRGGIQEWKDTHKAVVEAMFQLESDDLPCRLDRLHARSVTDDVPFDFSGLYQPDRAKMLLAPVGRDTPIFMDDEAPAFELSVPKPLREKCKTCPWTLTAAETGAKIAGGELAPPPPDGDGRAKLTQAAAKPGVYVLKAQAIGADGKPLGECQSEVVVAGAIPQATGPAGQAPKLKRVDEVDLTQDDPGHDFFSFSGKSEVVKTPQGAYRRTLTWQECRADLERQGLSSSHANDWFGARFRTTPGKVYVLEVEYPDLAYMSASAYLLEPKDEAADGRCRPILRTASGVVTGSFLPHDGRLKVMQIVHFASAAWMAACWQNAHYGRPSADKVLDPACARRMTLYEVQGDLPALDAPSTLDRQVGVYCESGGLALCSFGPEKLRGENGNWSDRPEHAAYYRHAYPAVANLIRYMRYRGDTTLFFGIHRYRPSMFPSRTFPPASSEWDVDLPGLVARMFQKNGLHVVLNVMANNPLPTSRLHEYTHYDVVQGANDVGSVNQDGRRDPPGRSGFPSSNPLHPAVRGAYARLAAELGHRYGRLPAVSGVSFLTGQSWWEPYLTIPPMGESLSDEEADRILIGATCDDETMRQFEQWAHVTLPGKAPEPDRFKRRHEWIMKNAKEKFLQFRCWAMAQTHLAFQRAFAGEAPGKDYLAIDFYYDVFHRKREWPSPLDAVRRIGFGPDYCHGVPGFVYCAYVPELNGCTYWEHSDSSWDIVDRIRGFVADDRLAGALADGRTARFLHRQFYEQSVFLPKDSGRRWIWAPGVEFLGCISYPQQGGRGYLADFATMLAHGTPAYVAYCWCDSTIPLGHEPAHREMAAVYRSLPPGGYREADRAQGVFARVRERGSRRSTWSTPRARPQSASCAPAARAGWSIP